MNIQANYDTLCQLRNDIQLQSQKSIAFALFNQQKIKNFFQQNSMRLQIADKKMNELIEKHVEHGEDLKPIVLEENDGMVKHKFLSEEDEKTFNDEYKVFMSRGITISC